MFCEAIEKLRGFGIDLPDEEEAIARGASPYSPNAAPIGLGGPAWSLHGRSPAFHSAFFATAWAERWHDSFARTAIELHNPDAADEITALFNSLADEALRKLTDDTQRDALPQAPDDAPRATARRAAF